MGPKTRGGRMRPKTRGGITGQGRGGGRMKGGKYIVPHIVGVSLLRRKDPPPVVNAEEAPIAEEEEVVPPPIVERIAEANLTNEEDEEDEETEGEEEEKSEEESDDEEEGEDKEQEEEDEEEVDLEKPSEAESSDSHSDSGHETMALQPLRMYFPATEYTKKVKISTRCYVKEFLSTLDKLQPPLTRQERKWFETHPQFRHIFHLPKDNNHKLQGMWMLLIRTACTEKKKEAWFLVNGVPVRYGLREHALISGLNCKNYPLNYNELGGKNFVRRLFGDKKVRYEDVKGMLEAGMRPSQDRLKMLVLYFLCSIIIGQTKCGNDAKPVVDFFQRAVDNLELCRAFPWG